MMAAQPTHQQGHTMHRRTLLLATLATATGPQTWMAQAHAQTPPLTTTEAVAGVATPAVAWAADLPAGRLLGQGDFRWLGFRVYHAQLWVDAQWPTPEAQAMQNAASSSPAVNWHNQRFVLALRYYRAITREQFIKATLDEIKRLGVAPVDGLRLQAWQEALQQHWQDVQEGDSLCALHQPGQGCQFYNQHGKLGYFDDADFSRAFFAIWLHPQSRDGRLQRHLLGQT